MSEPSEQAWINAAYEKCLHSRYDHDNDPEAYQDHDRNYSFDDHVVTASEAEAAQARLDEIENITVTLPKPHLVSGILVPGEIPKITIAENEEQRLDEITVTDEMFNDAVDAYEDVDDFPYCKKALRKAIEAALRARKAA